MKNFTTDSGFTLIETMVAVSILALSVAGPLFTANRAIVAAMTARDQLTASYLAQEGVEYVHRMRDDEYLSAFLGDPATASSVAWTNFIDTAITQCISPKICTLDPVQGSASPLASCPGNSCSAPLYLLSNGVYSQQNLPGSKVTPFIRTIQATTLANEEKIVSTVSWDYHNTQHTVTISNHLTPWQ